MIDKNFSILKNKIIKARVPVIDALEAEVEAMEALSEYVNDDPRDVVVEFQKRAKMESDADDNLDSIVVSYINKGQGDLNQIMKYIKQIKNAKEDDE